MTDPIRTRHDAEQASRGKAGKKSRAFSGDHRLARMYKFAGEQSRKAKVAKSRKKMRQQSQRKNRGRR